VFEATKAKMAETTMVNETMESVGADKRGKRDRRVGTVVSDKAQKAIAVRYDYIVKHPIYGKYYKRSTTLHTHDEKNEARAGDVVEVAACRRLSKTKCWRLVRVVRRAT